jgi:hypothetical protein
LKDLDAIYFAARELPPGERPAYLVEACRGDDPLRARVEQMLAVAEEAEAFGSKRRTKTSARPLDDTKSGRDWAKGAAGWFMSPSKPNRCGVSSR